METYDNYGQLTLSTKGDKIKLAGNKIEEMVATDDGTGTMKRSRKDSFYWYQKVIRSNGENLG